MFDPELYNDIFQLNREALMGNILIKAAEVFMISISTLFLINCIIGLWYMHISVLL